MSLFLSPSYFSFLNNFATLLITLDGNRNAGAIILKIAYGYTIEPHGTDPLVDLADRAVSQFSAASQPGIWLVDIIPFRKLSPLY